MNVNKMFKVKIENEEQLDIVLSHKNVSEIILSRDSFSECDLQRLVNRIKKSNKLAWILLERISRYEENMKPLGANADNGAHIVRPYGAVGANAEVVGANAEVVGVNAKVVGANACGAMTVGAKHREPDDLRTSTDKIFAIKNLDGVIIQNLDSFAYTLRKINKVANENLKIELNYTMNCYNSETKKLYEKLYNEKRKNAYEVPILFTAPVELNIYELSDVGYDTMILYSYIDTMVSANCLYKNITQKNNSLGATFLTADNVAFRKHREPTCKYRFDFKHSQNYSSYIIDRKNKKLHYKTYCKYCYNKIFNVEPLYLLDKLDEIEKFLNPANKINKNVDIVGANADNGAHIVRPYGVVGANADNGAHIVRPYGVVGANADNGAHIVRPYGAVVANAGAVGAKHREPTHTYRLDFSFETATQVKDILDFHCPDSFTRGHFKNSIK